MTGALLLAGMFPLCHCIQTSSVAHPPTIQWVQWALCPEVKWMGFEADHSPPTSAEVENMWSSTSTSPYIILCLVNYRMSSWCGT